MENAICTNLNNELAETLKGKIGEKDVLPVAIFSQFKTISSSSNPLPAFFRAQLKDYRILGFTLYYKTAFQSKFAEGITYGQKRAFFSIAIKEPKNLIVIFTYSLSGYITTQHRKIAQAIKQAAGDSFSKSSRYRLKGAGGEWDWEIYEFHKNDKRGNQLKKLCLEEKISYLKTDL